MWKHSVIHGTVSIGLTQRIVVAGRKTERACTAIGSVHRTASNVVGKRGFWDMLKDRRIYIDPQADFFFMRTAGLQKFSETYFFG